MSDLDLLKEQAIKLRSFADQHESNDWSLRMIQKFDLDPRFAPSEEEKVEKVSGKRCQERFLMLSSSHGPRAPH